MTTSGLSVPRTCSICGETFAARRADARTCSARCRIRAHRARRDATPREGRPTRADWETILLAASAGSWVYFADVFAELGATSNADYQAAWHAVGRLHDRGAIAVHRYVFGQPRLLIGPAGTQPPVLRPEPRSR